MNLHIHYLQTKHRTDTLILCHEHQTKGSGGTTNHKFKQVRILFLLVIWPAFLGLVTSISLYGIWGLTSRPFVTLNWTFVTPWQTGQYRGKSLEVVVVSSVRVLRDEIQHSLASLRPPINKPRLLVEVTVLTGLRRLIAWSLCCIGSSVYCTCNIICTVKHVHGIKRS